MADLSDFERGKIVGIRMVWPLQRKKTFTAKHKSGRKLSERDRRTLHRILGKDRRTTDLKITSELNEHLYNPVSIKTFPHKSLFSLFFFLIGLVYVWKQPKEAFLLDGLSPTVKHVGVL